MGNTYDYGVQRKSVTNLGKTNYYAYDERGSVLEIADKNSKVSMYYSYGAFGETTISYRNYVKNPYRYNAEFVDWVPGIPDFQYLRARYYNPNEGKFINHDSLFDDKSVPITQNSYVYCGNNAVNLIDPSGHGWLSDKCNGAEKLFLKHYNCWFNSDLIHDNINTSFLIRINCINIIKIFYI